MLWIWLMIVLNAAVAVWTAVGLLPDAEIGSVSTLVRLSASVSLLYVFGAVQLWLRNKWGFSLIIIASAFSILVSVLLTDPDYPEYTFGQIIGIILNILILYGILQIRKDGQSAWKQLESKWNKTVLKISLPVFAVLLTGVWLLPNSAVREAKTEYDVYQLLTESCSDLIEEGTQSEPQPLIDAVTILSEIRMLEERHGQVDGRYNQADRVASELQVKAEPIAASWASAAEAQKRIGNSEKALEFYTTALNLHEDENVRDEFEELASEYGFMRPLAMELAGDDGVYGSPIAKEGLEYIYPRIKYEPLDIAESHEVEFIVKFYEDGRLSVGGTPGCSYRKVYSVEPAGDGYLYLDGYGNTSGTSYSNVSTVRVELWCGDRKLITETQTLE